MSKKRMAISGLTGMCLAVAAFAVVSMVGVPDRRPATPGTDDYYISGPLEQPLPKVITNLRSNRGKTVFSLEAVAVYELGRELRERYGDAGPLFAENENRIKDRLNRLILTKDLNSVQGPDNQALLAQQIREIIQRLVFPEQKGRIIEILFVSYRHE